MELRVLRYFLTVVSEQNISKAAEQLHISQPTISKQLQELESELGVTLFTRGSRSIQLTEAGEYFVSQARQIVALADKTMTNIQQAPEIVGNITLGCAEDPSMTQIADIIKILETTAPKVQLQMQSANGEVVREGLQKGLLDFGVVLEPFDKSDYNFLTLAGSTPWGLLVSTESQLADYAVITPADLQNERLLISQQSGVHALLDDWLGSTNKDYIVTATFNLLYNASLFAMKGVGSVFCLDGIINTTNLPLRFIPLEPTLTTHASLIWPKEKPLSSAANAFLKIAQKNLSRK